MLTATNKLLTVKMYAAFALKHCHSENMFIAAMMVKRHHFLFLLINFSVLQFKVNTNVHTILIFCLRKNVSFVLMA